MKIILYVFLIGCCFASKNGLAQVDPKIETGRLMELLNKLEGTYQVQIVDSRELLAIPLSLMDTIALKRGENEVKYVWLKSNIRVKILSKSEIASPSFHAIPRISYISSSDLN